MKIPSKSKSLYTQISAALSSHQGSLFVEWIAVNVETHSWLKCREYMSVKFSVINGTSMSYSLSLRLREHAGREEDFKIMGIF